MIDQAVIFVNEGADPLESLWAIMPLLLAMLGLLLISNTVVQGQSLAEKNMRARLRFHINHQIMVKAETLDLSHFEQAEFYDRMQNAHDETNQRAVTIVVNAVTLLQLIITFVSFALLLMRFSPWLVVILLAATLPSFGLQNEYGRLTFRLLNYQAPERRQMLYYEKLLTVDRYFKEIKLFGLGQYMLAHYANLFWSLFHEDMALAQRRSIISIVWGSVGFIGFWAAITWIIYRTLNGEITFGDAVLYLELFERSHYIGQQMLSNLLRLSENSLFISNIFTFLAYEPQVKTPSQPENMPDSIQHGITFCDVSFTYPGQTTPALQNINLTIYPGEKLALVGLNGSGKTTLVKLLARLYEPTSGKLLLDDTPLDCYTLNDWHQKISIIFQDFVQYQFTAADNIGLSQIDALSNRQQIKKAAEKGGADEMIGRLPQGYDTQLGKWFAEGHELSQGQWQKIALSRAFMRQAEILILDEPTASLDAQQEHRIYERFHSLTKDKTAVLISHRFSTVRMADRIVVLKNGRILEIGSHEQLLQQNGFYAQLFQQQAAGYR